MKYRAANYSLLDYVEEWNSKSAIVKSAVQKACPGSFPEFMAPSFALLDFMTTRPGLLGTCTILHTIKMVVTNLRASNQTTSDRPYREYKFHVPAQHKSARIERLIGPGSDALDNIIFGISYDHALNGGEAGPTEYERRDKD